jgi:hypothetical protein
VCDIFEGKHTRVDHGYHHHLLALSIGLFIRYPQYLSAFIDLMTDIFRVRLYGLTSLIFLVVTRFSGAIFVEFLARLKIYMFSLLGCDLYAPVGESFTRIPLAFVSLSCKF